MVSNNGCNSNQLCTEEYVDDGDDEGDENEKDREDDEGDDPCHDTKHVPGGNRMGGD